MHMGELAPASCVGRNGRTDKVYSLSCLVRIIPFGSGFPARVLIESWTATRFGLSTWAQLT